MPNFPLRFDGDLLLIGRGPEGDPPRSPIPDWAQADPRRIRAALARATAQPSGGWAVIDATRALREGGPRKVVIAGRELVAWIAPDGTPHVAPDACPHMGASLSCGH